METVYVIDADVAIRDALTTLVESFDIPVKAYADSEAFLLSVRNVKNGFVLVDAEMPGLNGMGLLNALRSDGNTMPVILLTANANAEFLRRAQGAGAAGVLRKPFVGEDAWTTFTGDQPQPCH